MYEASCEVALALLLVVKSSLILKTNESHTYLFCSVRLLDGLIVSLWPNKKKRTIDTCRTECNKGSSKT